MLQEFKKFLIKGNAVDMAVGFIFGAAFATLIKSLIAKIVMPFVGLLMGKIDFSNLFFTLSSDGVVYKTVEEAKKAGVAVVEYGTVITEVINFIILGFIIFMMVRTINKMQKKEDEKPAKKADDIILLEEIRDSLKK